VVQVANYSHSTRLLAATTLRNVLGTRNLSELLVEREAISHTMVSSFFVFIKIPLTAAEFFIQQLSLDDATDPWGVKVERVEM
jgi:erythrocyte band 7 integral membrane protein